uniref:Cytochrome b5 heme-binding domain-containing protein n=1 Tax=Chaetoceros debilis TaxID=122233 RepID=A0A7S3V462_9STRA|mmetsp:Transcript_28057/g.42995  ORF Transcript_28057/g.42995 Transcript_28057/m.42995 type:complete len:210 (+) Transcript_28057:36-665(+)
MTAIFNTPILPGPLNIEMCESDNDTIDRNMAPQLQTASKHDSDTSIPDLVYIQSSCDACPNCPDVCASNSCLSCREKAKMDSSITERPSRNKTPSNPFLSRNVKNDESELYITPCQLARHNTKESAWLLCGYEIFDATMFIKGHPGGESSILRKAGGVVDCARDLKFHSPRAIKMWKQSRIGILRPCCGRDGCGNNQKDEKLEESCVIS